MTSMKAAILLGICIALYLAFAAEAVHFLSSPDAAAALVPDVSEQPDNSRECRPSAALVD